MSNRLLIPGIALALVLTALTFPQLASSFFLNLANTQIVRAVSLPAAAPDRAALLTGANINLDRARSFFNQPRLALASARAALARNDTVSALEIFNASGTILESDPIAQFTWADAAWRANQEQVAFAHWRTAGALEYFRQQMHRALEAHTWHDAENFARITVGIDANFADGHYVLGDALSHQDVNNPDSLLELDRARELTQDKELVAAVLSRQAEILARQNKWRDAIDVFNEARQIAPIDARPRTGYAIVLLQLDPQAQEQSVALLRQVVDDSPWYIPAYIALAKISESIGQTYDAQTWLQAALEKNPNDATLLFALGQFYARQHRFDQAKATLLLAMKNEMHTDVFLEIANALAELPAQ